MKALVFNAYGSAENLQETEMPTPDIGSTDILIENHASTVNVLDTRIRNGELHIITGKSFPKISGIDVAGIVKSVGNDVTGFKPGDAVYGALHPFKGGAHAEIVTISQDAAAITPKGITMGEAACIPITGLAALVALRDIGQVRKGTRLLINGCSGAAGLFAIQLAKYFGCEITGVCGPNGQEISHNLGADTVINYKEEDVSQSTTRFDVIVDFAGKLPFKTARKLMTQDGRYIDPSPDPAKMIGSKLANPFRSQKNLMLQTFSKKEDLEFLSNLFESGAFKPVIAERFPLKQAQNAFLSMESGGSVGKIVIDIVTPNLNQKET